MWITSTPLRSSFSPVDASTNSGADTRRRFSEPPRSSSNSPRDRNVDYLKSVVNTIVNALANTQATLRDSGLTRMPMDEISKARPSRGFHSRMSPFTWHSVGWAIFHGLLSWVYVIYFVLRY